MILSNASPLSLQACLKKQNQNCSIHNRVYIFLVLLYSQEKHCTQKREQVCSWPVQGIKGTEQKHVLKITIVNICRIKFQSRQHKIKIQVMLLQWHFNQGLLQYYDSSSLLFFPPASQLSHRLQLSIVYISSPLICQLSLLSNSFLGCDWWHLQSLTAVCFLN